MRRRVPWGALIILLAGAAAFGLSVWIRLSINAPSALEKLIAAHAPAENVQILAGGAGNSLLVGTSLGVIEGRGSRWTRVAGLQTDVKSVLREADGALLLAGDGTGVARYQTGQLTTLLPGDAQAVAEPEPGRLFALVGGQALQASADGGRTWSQLVEFEIERIHALAANGTTLAAGGLQGGIYVSQDGGKRWESRPAPGGSVTALQFDPSKSGRLWVCAGGAALYSDDGGTTWRPGVRKGKSDRLLIALAPAPAGETGMRGISADGLLVTLGE